MSGLSHSLYIYFSILYLYYITKKSIRPMSVYTHRTHKIISAFPIIRLQELHRVWTMLHFIGEDVNAMSQHLSSETAKVLLNGRDTRRYRGIKNNTREYYILLKTIDYSIHFFHFSLINIFLI